MFMAIDIGNTNIAIGLFKGKRLYRKFYFPTAIRGLNIYRGVNKGLKSFDIDAKSIKAALISSVVPAASKAVIDILKNRFCIKFLLLGKDIKIPIRNLYKNPEQVGQDRLVNAYACLKLYGCPAIVVDFGTATTFDYLNKKGAYAGGLITAGVEISLSALAERTALLPKIELKKPKNLIGRDTVESMRSGVLYGLASMCDGVIEKIRKKYSSHAMALATGGLATFFAPYCKQIDFIDKNLTLKGIYFAYRDVIGRRGSSI